MSQRGYTLIDFTPPDGIWSDQNRAVRFFEFVRTRIIQIVPDLPTECEADIFVSGHPHCSELVLMLGLHLRDDLLDAMPDPFEIIEAVSAWCEGLSDQEVESIVATAPTWNELVARGTHPKR